MSNLQIQASDPHYSVWVSASAGTGKTKILTDRILRLLIGGVNFEKILCLTYTKAAANEMQERLNKKLAQWAACTNYELATELDVILGRRATNNELKLARILYNKLLSIQDKINIYTIHSFCQKTLGRFPLEAGISPGFQILDDIKLREVIMWAKKQVYLNPANEQLINFFITNFHEVTINDIFNDIIQHKLKFKRLFTNKNGGYGLGDISYPCPSSEILRKQLAALLSMLPSSPAASDIIVIIEAAMRNEESLLSFFLTKDGAKRKRIINKEIASQNQDLYAKLQELQEQVYQFDQQQKTALLLEYSNMLLKLAENFINIYESYKVKHSLLDYDDLIYFTRKLLTNSENKEWVLYKLDGGIEHLLVDEAQDTSPEQWEIINAVIEEFYAGEGASKTNRTIFVVGDEKQSIFSFQGADIAAFNLMPSYLKSKLQNANKVFKIINLEWSYRSTREILTVVHNIFTQIKKSKPENFAAENPNILPFRSTHIGKVELWLPCKAEKAPELFWSPAEIPTPSLSPAKQLAVDIATFIKKQLDSGEILPSTGLPVTAADFMILVRTRDQFTLELINQLKLQELEVSGIDRMTLNQNLSVIDLISIAKFVLSPYDNLNLAALLKSPIIGISEEELQQWVLSIKDREPYALPARVSQQLQFLLQLYKASSGGDFFHTVVDCLKVREILAIANGPESDDAINEFLYLSSDYANKIDNSLQSFIYWFEENEIEIKRNVEALDKIRVMTAHSAKGLQAPVVILCDTTSLPINRNKFVWTEDGGFLSSMQAASSPQFFKDLKEKAYQKELQEYFRLFYVAMTRAEDHLIICGHHAVEQLPADCWYELAAKSMQDLTTASLDSIITYQCHAKEEAKVEPKKPESLINFDATAAKGNGNASQARVQGFQLPSNSLAATYNIQSVVNKINSPLISRSYLEYGRIFHKILEDSIKTKDLNKLKAHPLIGTLPLKLQNKIHTSINNLLANEEFLKFTLADELKTEVSIGIAQGQIPKIGRIDLLVINSNYITIIDYKSDANPSFDERFIAINYIEQLNFYRQVIQAIYPYHQIICKILWLENGSFSKEI